MWNWYLESEPTQSAQKLEIWKKGRRRPFSSLFTKEKVAPPIVVKEDKGPKMPDVYFVFGPGHSYYFYCGGAERMLKVPEPFIKYVINSSEAPEKKLQRPLCVALGPIETEYFAMYTTLEDTARFTYDLQNSGLELMEWLKPIPKAVGTHVAIGPCRSMYACITNSTSPAHFYMTNVPASFKSLIDSSISKPNRKFTTQVSFGYDGSWFVLWPNGDVSWEFEGHYPELENLLKELPAKCVSYVALNPWAAGQYFMVLEDGTVRFCLPAEWAPSIEEDVAAWQNRFKTTTISTIRCGRKDSKTEVIRLGEDKKGHDLPPPYEKKYAN